MQCDPVLLRLPIFQTLSEARSRLYQRRFLRPRPHYSAFVELYVFFERMRFNKFNSSLHHSRFLIYFETFAPFNWFCKINSIFAGFQETTEFIIFSILSNSHQIASEFYTKLPSGKSGKTTQKRSEKSKRKIASQARRGKKKEKSENMTTRKAISQNFSDFERSDVKMTIFQGSVTSCWIYQKICRKISDKSS